MSVQAANGDAGTGAIWTAPSRALALEKPRQTESSGDHNEQPDARRNTKTAPRNAYRFDTVRVSRWDGPLLSAPYAAQVIGQALATRTVKLPRGAYRAPAIASAHVFDRRV